MLRIIITGIIAIYLWHSSETDGAILALAYLTLGFVFFGYLLTTTKISPARRVLSITSDIFMLTVALYFADEIGAILMATYLWIITGAGFRYGIAYLAWAATISITAQVLLFFLNDYWGQNENVAIGWLIVSIVIPIFMASLIKKLQKAVSFADEANKAKSQFIAKMSHELRTPLNGIIGASELMSLTHLDTKQQQYSGIIQSSGHTLLSLVDDILDITKIESGKQTTERAPFYLHNLISTVTQLFLSQAEKKHLTLNTHIAPDVPGILEGDELHIQQVLMNFISNALKFTEKGSIEVSVEKTANMPDDRIWLRFRVRDTGIGLSEDAQQKIFDSFVQADASVTRQYGGSGLGTTISKELTELMGGQVGLFSKEGEGSTFWFDLPFQHQNERTSIPVSNTQMPRAAFESFTNQSFSAHNQPLNILAAEDNAVNQMLLRELLEGMGHQVTMTQDGDEAFQALMDTQHPFDLAILDINMPHMSGLEVLEAYRLFEKEDHLPVIILSADATATNIQICLDAGADYYLTKPIERHKLSAAINNAVPPQDSNIPLNQLTNESQYIDTGILNEICNMASSTGFIQELIHTFIQNASEKIAHLEQSKSDHDTPGFLSIIHALNGSASSVGATVLQILCANIEQQDELTPESIRDYISELQATFDKSKLELTQYLQDKS